MNTVSVLARNFINLVYPLHCLLCSKPLDPMDELRVCPACTSSLAHDQRPAVDTLPHLSKVFSACVYEGAAKELIQKFKYGSRPYLWRVLSGVMSSYASLRGEVLENIDAITFVPLTGKRLKEREFNQSKLLAAGLAAVSGIPLIDLLEKTISTRPQNMLSREERLSNLNGAFAVRTTATINGMDILIVDDVMTTGATLMECAKTLRRAGSGRVRGFVLARGT